MKYKYILIDMDGTVCDSARGILNCLKYALDFAGVEIPDENTLRKFLGPPFRESLKQYLNLESAKMEEVILKYRERLLAIGMYENELYLGVADLIKDLKSDGRSIILATGKVQDTAEMILEHFDLLKYFDFVAGCELDGMRSYKHEIIDYALENMRALHEKSQVVMIGDRYHDIAGAKKAGVASIGVLYGYGTRDELEEHNADYIVESVEDLRKLLFE